MSISHRGQYVKYLIYGVISIRQGAIALFDGKLPLALRGAGSRRIMAMAISKAAVKEGAVILVDEVENSLEPHRLRHLIRQLRPRKNDLHQVILTTHSPIAVVECQATELHVVRSENGKTTAQQVEHGLQAVARKIPEAFLSKKVCICEGKTEAGLLIGLDAEYWHRKHETDRPWFKYRTMAEAGVAPIADPRGGGDEAPKLTLSMASLGYQVAFFGDSDKADKLTPSVREMEAAEIEVILWPGEKQNGLSVEERICLDLPVGGLEELVTLAVELESNEDKPDDVWRRIHDTLNSKGFRFQSDKDIRTLIQQSDEKAVRAAIGESAKHKNAGWFKRVEKGTRLGELLSHHLDSMQRTPTFDTLARLENWIYEPEF